MADCLSITKKKSFESNLNSVSNTEKYFAYYWDASPKVVESLFFFDSDYLNNDLRVAIKKQQKSDERNTKYVIIINCSQNMVIYSRNAKTDF